MGPHIARAASAAPVAQLADLTAWRWLGGREVGSGVPPAAAAASPASAAAPAPPLLSANGVPVLLSREKNQLFDLYAVVNHYGSLTAGHYTAHCAAPAGGGAWHAFNDRIVSPIADPAAAVVTPAAYILCLVRRDIKEQWRATAYARGIANSAQRNTDATTALDIDALFPLPPGAAPLDDASLRSAMAVSDASAAARAALPVAATVPSLSSVSAGSGVRAAQPGCEVM